MSHTSLTVIIPLTTTDVMEALEEVLPDTVKL